MKEGAGAGSGRGWAWVQRGYVCPRSRATAPSVPTPPCHAPCRRDPRGPACRGCRVTRNRDGVSPSSRPCCSRCGVFGEGLTWDLLIRTNYAKITLKPSLTDYVQEWANVATVPQAKHTATSHTEPGEVPGAQLAPKKGASLLENRNAKGSRGLGVTEGPSPPRNPIPSSLPTR